MGTGYYLYCKPPIEQFPIDALSFRDISDSVPHQKPFDICGDIISIVKILYAVKLPAPFADILEMDGKIYFWKVVFPPARGFWRYLVWFLHCKKIYSRCLFVLELFEVEVWWWWNKLELYRFLYYWVTTFKDKIRSLYYLWLFFYLIGLRSTKIMIDGKQWWGLWW